jgi:peptidoglycan/xylan/chitin deacetylase (PgdA/CDA1 family)
MSVSAMLAVSRAMRQIAKAGLCGLYKYSGTAWLQEKLTRAAGRRFAAILLFHRVTDDIPEDALTVGSRRFRGICRLLRRCFNVVPLTEVFRRQNQGMSFQPRTVAITFDDCYRDNLFAARMLAELGLPATFFVPTAFVDTDHVFAWDMHLPRMPNLTWDDLREMVRLGFEIGSHTVSHANLGRLGLQEAKEELAQSKAALEKQLIRPVRWFAYPFGGEENLRPEFEPLIEQVGYEGCLSGFGGFVVPSSGSRVLPRVPVPDFHSMLHLELHLRGCLDWYYALKRRAGLMANSPCREALRRAQYHEVTTAECGAALVEKQ